MAVDDTWHDRSIRTQKAEVARWFGAVDGRPAFFAADGRAYPLSDSERAGLQQAAEGDAIRLIVRLDRRIWLIAGIVVATVVVGQMWLTDVPDPVRNIVHWGLRTLWSAHGVWLLVEALRAMRDMRTIRADVVHALAPRAAIRDMAGERRFIDPWAQIAVALCIGLFILAIGSEIASHFGVDILSVIQPWLVIWLLVMFLFLALASRITLALRGRR